MQYAAEIDVAGSHRPDGRQIRFRKRRAPMCRKIRQLLKFLCVPGHDEIGEQGQRARNGPLLLAAATTLWTNGVGMDRTLQLMHRLSMVKHPPDGRAERLVSKVPAEILRSNEPAKTRSTK